MVWFPRFSWEHPFRKSYYASIWSSKSKSRRMMPREFRDVRVTRPVLTGLRTVSARIFAFWISNVWWVYGYFEIVTPPIHSKNTFYLVIGSGTQDIVCSCTNEDASTTPSRSRCFLSKASFCSRSSRLDRLVRSSEFRDAVLVGSCKHRESWCLLRCLLDTQCKKRCDQGL